MSYDEWKLEDGWDYGPTEEEREEARQAQAEAKLDELREEGWSYEDIISGRYRYMRKYNG